MNLTNPKSKNSHQSIKKKKKQIDQISRTKSMDSINQINLPIKKIKQNHLINQSPYLSSLIINQPLRGRLHKAAARPQRRGKRLGALKFKEIHPSAGPRRRQNSP